MIGFGMVTAALSLLGLFMMRGGRIPAEKKWFYRGRAVDDPVPLIANSFGWIFTEMGRQPWVVFSQMFTRDGVSPLVGPGYVWTSLIVLSLLYLALAIVEVGLLVRYVKAGPPDTEAEAKAPLEPPGRATTARRRPSGRRAGRAPAVVRLLRRGCDDTARVLVRPRRGSCSAATSCWKASTSASACCCRCWAAATTSTAAS